MSDAPQVYCLSHVLDSTTPTYGRYDPVEIHRKGDMCAGDLCNSSILKFNSHSGTHIDVARHFIKDGATLDSFAASGWHFTCVEIIDVPIAFGQARLLNRADIPEDLSEECEAILIRTGFGAFRQREEYIFDYPGLTGELATFLLEKFPKLRAIGMDFISVCRFSEPEPGIAAHQTLLSRNGMVLIEDLNLEPLPKELGRLNLMIVAPLLFKDGDGAPATVFGYS